MLAVYVYDMINIHISVCYVSVQNYTYLCTDIYGLNESEKLN